MRLLITGSRNWRRDDVVADQIEYYTAKAYIDRDEVVVVHGACPNGADDYARRAGDSMRKLGFDVITEAHPADWDTFGRPAGFIRNDAMARLGADVCLAFIRDDSKGASHCRDRALAYGIPVRTFREDRFGAYQGEEGAE